MQTLDELLQAAVQAINESGLEPNVAITQPVGVLEKGDPEIFTSLEVKWDAESEMFLIVVE